MLLKKAFEPDPNLQKSSCRAQKRQKVSEPDPVFPKSKLITFINRLEKKFLSMTLTSKKFVQSTKKAKKSPKNGQLNYNEIGPCFVNNS